MKGKALMKSKNTATIGTIIAIIVLIIIVVLSNIGQNKNKVQNTVSKVFNPIQNGIIYLKNKITGNTEELAKITSLEQENQNLKDSNSKLQEQVRELEVLKSENNTLKEYLNLKNKYADYSTVPGYVISRTYSNYDKIITINVGSNDGIEVNMPVISEQGLVGRVMSVAGSSAKVETIIDTASTVSANISSAKESMLVRGTISSTNELQVSSIPTEATILQGDEIVTSGLGGIYPKGILIGTVDSVVNTKNEVDRYATVKTATDFNLLSEILVITSK